MNGEAKRINIAFLTAFDLEDIQAWSWAGTFYFMAQALEKYCGEVSHIGPINCWEQVAARVIRKGSSLLLKKNYVSYHNFLVARKYAKVAARRLARGTFDVIFTPVGEPEIAFLKTDIPIVLFEDATYGQLMNYYPAYSNLLKRSIYELNTLEELALKKASLVLCSSEWAARSALEDYHTEKRKVHVLPQGTNIEHPPAREEVWRKRKSDRCRLLFVGVDWQRKGGEIAFETLLRLEELGIQAELIVCGCVPPPQFSHERMMVIPYLYKSDEKQREQLEQLYMTSDFFLLPTRSESYGMVFAEASAFGLPSITSDTGGVSEVVRNGENGFVLAYHARGAEYAKVIADIYRDDQRYKELVRSSRAAFDTRLTWDSWGMAVADLIAQLLGR
ncbi:MAG TPA: glycosyltransferase family 4 protein [Ktedonobacteraceae bacterium]|nr:glycosyltransferase family 4 protein [Ktedonobacteraceae bacterium]